MSRRRDLRDKYDRALDRLDPIRSCRACSAIVTGDSGVKYGIRHYLCLACAFSRGETFLRKLPTWQLENLPAIPLRRAGLWDAVSDEIAGRPGYR